ncbi:MAG: SapC family protein [Endozoicomonas sp. (ex Botrylloides leachii)]|nr:SapC family protein [Endozoicomonas sp. (ex Botrylloides leachii)]
MTSLLFYNEPEFLCREAHKALKFKALSDYSFTEHVNSVPLTGIEFFEASRDMPVLFRKEEDGNFLPLALLSLMNEGHKQLDETGSWSDSYIPAFVRRYPFAMTDEGAVCFDRKSKQLAEEEGKPLFNDKGENTKELNNILTFLNSYDKQQKATRDYCAECKELDLLAPFNLQVMLDNNPLRLEGLYAISEEKLAKLPADKVNTWFCSGWLAWSYAHLHSLSAISRLAKKQKRPASAKQTSN